MQRPRAARATNSASIASTTFKVTSAAKGSLLGSLPSVQLGAPTFVRAASQRIRPARRLGRLPARKLKRCEGVRWVVEWGFS